MCIGGALATVLMGLRLGWKVLVGVENGVGGGFCGGWWILWWLLVLG